MPSQVRKLYCVDDYNSVVRFEQLRRELLDTNDGQRLGKPLAYWALASDRRLPFAFLGRTLGELLDTPFDDLLATSGVGHKKIASLITLLDRAATDSGSETTLDPDPVADDREPQDASASDFDPLSVSEVMWSRWRATVKRHDLGLVKLGHLAPSLQALPTVIWHRPLDDYIELSLSDIRQLRTHGEKRVRAILEIFWGVHEATARTVIQPHLHRRLIPVFVHVVETWFIEILGQPEQVTLRRLRERLAQPLLDQVETDAGLTLRRIASERLGAVRGPLSVRQQSRKMGVTRARVYQQLEECSKIMEIRWPEGERFFAAAWGVLDTANIPEEALLFFGRVSELFFPRNLVENEL